MVVVLCYKFHLIFYLVDCFYLFCNIGFSRLVSRVMLYTYVCVYVFVDIFILLSFMFVCLSVRVILVLQVFILY